MTAELGDEFAFLLRELRTRGRLTQQGLAGAAGLSLRAVSDLERGAAALPRRETVRVLGDALGLVGAERIRFESAARGRPPAKVPAAAAAAVRSLPHDPSAFTGRQRELEQLARSATAASAVVSIYAIGGMAGVGKTVFAVRAAHQLAGRFPGGPVFLPLHGHTPGQAPVDPADALASLLLAVGVPPAQVPPGLEARGALWRDRVAGRPLLLVLDDAVGSEQVRPLLPGEGGSLVLVTSRRHLSALDGATVIGLDILPPADAAALLVQVAGRTGLSAGDPEVREIAELCGHLPLAIGLVARQLRRHPSWSAAGRAAELASARDRLALLQTENLSVAAAFDLSYATLTEERRRLFRHLGLHPGADIDVYAAAALDGTGLPAARRGLEDLYDQNLLTEPAQGRYRLHDLIRAHARALAGRLDPEPDREAAVARLLDYYQHTAATANSRIAPQTRPAPAAASVPPAAAPSLPDLPSALTWSRAERANVLACLDYAAAVGQHARVTGLTAGISALLRYDGPWADTVVRHTAAVQAAQHLGDQLSRANALSDLGNAGWLTDDYPASIRAYGQAAVLYRELGSRLGEANALSGLGLVQMTADLQASTQTLEQALGLYRELGDLSGQASALAHLGDVLRLTNDFPAAARALEEALGLYRDLGDRSGQAKILTYLGDTRRATGDFPAAVQAEEAALGLYRDLDNRRGQADALNCLGMVWQLTGDYPAAARALEQALAIYRDLSDRLGQANVLSNLGSVRRVTGAYPASAQALDEALGIYRDTGYRGGEAAVLNERGALHRVGGELALAQQCLRRSLELSRDVASSVDEAQALAELGRCALAAGDAGQAGALLRQALEIFQRTGAVEAAGTAAELDALGQG